MLSEGKLLNYSDDAGATYKKLYTLVEMAAQRRTQGSAEAIYAGKEKIDIDHF